jgi:hypothetical protein
MFTFNKKYFLLTCLLFIIDVIIALYFHDQFIRPYIGDLLVVIFIYCFVKTFLNSPVIITSIYVLLFAYAIEISQYFKFINYLGLQNSKAANLILGHTFEWRDMLAYTAGIAIVLWLEKLIVRRRQA